MPTHMLVLRVRFGDAIVSIRRRGLMRFARRLLSVRSWLPMPFADADATHPGLSDGENIIGGVDGQDEMCISRSIGHISGWALTSSGGIDRVAVHVDGQWVANARICQPRHDIRSDLPEARICGFHINVPSAQMPTDRDAIKVEFVAHTTLGESRRFQPRLVRLEQQKVVDPPATTRDFQRNALRRTETRTKPRIKVAVFTHDLGYGGGQLYLQELLRQLAPCIDIEATVLCPKDGPLRSELLRLGFQTKIWLAPSLSNAIDHDQEIDAVGRWLLDQDIDCVVANTLGAYYAVNAAGEAGIPSVWAIHESFPLETWSAHYTQERDGSEFFLSRIKTAFRLCSTVVFESDATRALFEQHGAGARFVKMPYGVDNAAIDTFLQSFDRDGARERLGIAKKEQMILCMATFEPRKQQILLAQAFAEVLPRHREATLWLVGDSPSHYAIALRQYLKRKGVEGRIRLNPIVPDPYPWYGMADGLVLLSDLESMPRSLLEAMSFGLPALATRVFGVPELIDDGRSGLLVEPNSLDGATQGLNRLLGLSDSERTSIGLAAREKIRTSHDTRGYADGYLSLIKSLVN